MWKVPRIWEDGECWIIGGGSSITTQFNIPDGIVKEVRQKKLSVSAYSPYMEKLHDKHVIGINSAYLIGNWIDFCFFSDLHWYTDNKERLRDYTGVVVGCSPAFGKTNNIHQKEPVKHLGRASNGWGIAHLPNQVCYNKNSGCAAISLAVHLGCKKIYLLGFDMKLDDGKQHWHTLYQKPVYDKHKQVRQKGDGTPFHRHLMSFPYIERDAKRMKVEIINVCPDSAITQFKKVSLSDVL